MSVDTCAVRCVEYTPTDHPLATRHGAHMLINLIAADQVWRRVSARGRTALRDAYLTAQRDAVAAGQTTGIPLPKLVGDVHPATGRALVRRRLVADGRLTGLGVEVVRWADLPRRPVRDVDTTGGAL